MSNLSEMFAEEPPDGTRLVVWYDGGNIPIVVERDDTRGLANGGHWYRTSDGSHIPRTLRQILVGATMVHAVVPLAESGLKLVDETEA